MGIRGTSQADGRSHSGSSGDGSGDSVQVKGKNGHQQRVFSVGIRPIGNLGCAINHLLEALSWPKKLSTQGSAGQPE
jgi:hypothetical protein